MEGMALEEKLEQMGFVDKARLEEVRAKWVESAKTMLVEGTPPQTISRWLSMPIEDVLMIESEIKKL
jgi:hypothetical protein